MGTLSCCIFKISVFENFVYFDMEKIDFSFPTKTLKLVLTIGLEVQ